MSDPKLNQSDFAIDFSVIGNATGQKFLGEQTLQQSPAPLAFSTVTQNRKLKPGKVQDNDYSFLKYSQKPQAVREVSRNGKIQDLLTDVSMHPLQDSMIKLADNPFGEVEKQRMRSMPYEANNDKSVEGEFKDDSSLGILSMDKMGDYSFGEVSMAHAPSATSFRSFHQSKRDIRLQSILEESMSSTKSEPALTNRAPNETMNNEKRKVLEKNALSLRYLLPPTETSLSYVENNGTDIGGAILKDFMKDISLREKLNFDDTGNFFPLAAPNNANVNHSINVDFRDDQISARSSSLGSSQRTVGTVCTAGGDTAFSNIFRKFSLDGSFLRDDLQLYAELPSYLLSDARIADSRMEKSSGGKSKHTASTVKAGENHSVKSSSTVGNAEKLSKSSSANGGANSPVLGKSSPFVGDDLPAEFEKINENEEFGNAEDFYKGLDAVEQECVHQHRFLQEEPMDGDNFKQNSSWMFNASIQDITRPSWMNSLPDEGNVDLGLFPRERRVTAGQLFGARTEALGTLDGDNCDSSTKRPTFGIVPPNNRSETQTNAKCDTVAELEPKMKVQKQIEKYLGPESTPSRSFLPMGSDIADMIRSASLSNDTMTMAQMALRLRAEKRIDKSNQVGTTVDKPMSTSVVTAAVPPSVRPKEALRNRQSAQLSTAQLRERTESSSLSRLCPDAMQTNTSTTASVADLALVEPNYSSDYSHSVLVDENFDGPSHCCVGTTSTFGITVKNNSNQWHRGKLVMMIMLVDGNEELSDASTISLAFPSGFTVQPHCSETLKITFIPKQVGKLSLTFGFGILPSDECAALMTIVRTLHLMVVTPQIEVEPIVVHFGEIPTDCCCFREVILQSATPASVPVKVSIEGDSSVRNSLFYFQKTNSQFVESVKVFSSNCITCDVPGNSGKENTGTKIVIALKTASSTGAEELKMETCNLRVELDSTENAVTLASVKLKAVVGAVQLHMNVKDKPLVLVATYPDPALARITLKNFSKIPLLISVGYLENCNNFFVSTQEITLNEQQQFDDLVVIFRPNSETSVSQIMESTLRLQVQPDGPIYTVKVVGKMEQFGCSRATGQIEVLESRHRTGTPPSPPVKGDSNYSIKRPEMESATSKLRLCKISLNPECIRFPDTKCGSSSVQKLKVSNKSSKDLKLTLLQPEEGSFVVSYTNLICKSVHYITVKIHFRPKTVGPVHGQVVVLASNDDGEMQLVASLQGVAI